ncbi:MAG: hypothetical protein QNJ55_18380 [Xenococcus sp. MO_188.B8]|nr:hypothetical protein [Xenococcus sp. MO_188.B8]
MLKLWKKRAFLLIIVTLLISQISFNSVLAEEVISSNTNNFSSSNIENINPKAETQIVPSTEDKKEVVPSKESQVTPKVESFSVNSSRPSDPYEKYFDAIKKFNEELYGENG